MNKTLFIIECIKLITNSSYVQQNKDDYFGIAFRKTQELDIHGHGRHMHNMPSEVIEYGIERGYICINPRCMNENDPPSPNQRVKEPIDMDLYIEKNVGNYRYGFTQSFIKDTLPTIKGFIEL